MPTFCTRLGKTLRAALTLFALLGAAPAAGQEVIHWRELEVIDDQVGQQPKPALAPLARAEGVRASEAKASSGGPQYQWEKTPERPWHKAVGDVAAPDGSGGSCSCVALGEGKGLAITNYHVVEGAYQRMRFGGSYRINFPGVGLRTAQLVGVDPSNDLAALEFAAAGGEVALPIATEFPQQGDQVEVAGYPYFSDGVLQARFAKVLGYDSSQGRNDLAVDKASISGDSGGAIVKDGQLVATLWGGPCASRGGPMTATHGAACDRLRAFVDNLATRRPWFGGSCPGGSCGPCLPGPESNGGSQYAPPPVTQQPAPQQPQPAPEQQPAVDIDAIVAAVLAKIDLAALRGKDGAPGPAGPAGAQGPAGPAGADGAAGQVDEAMIAAWIQAELQRLPLHVEILGPNGDVKQSTAAYLGGKLRLQLIPQSRQ